MKLLKIRFTSNRYYSVKQQTFLTFLMLSFSAISCETTLVPGYQKQVKPEPTKEIILDYEIYYVKKSYRKVDLKAKYIAGKIGDLSENPKVTYPKDGDLEIAQYNIESKVIASIIIPDPLAVPLDSTENLKSMSPYKLQDSASFRVHIQLLPGARYIGVHTINNPKAQLNTLRL